MTKKLFAKSAIATFVVLLGMALPCMGLFAQTVSAAAAPEAQAAVAEAEGPMQKGLHKLEYGVLLFGVGEVFGLVGMGIANNRRVKRMEQQAVHAPSRPQSDILLYQKRGQKTTAAQPVAVKSRVA